MEPPHAGHWNRLPSARSLLASPLLDIGSSMFPPLHEALIVRMIPIDSFTAPHWRAPTSFSFALAELLLLAEVRNLDHKSFRSAFANRTAENFLVGFLSCISSPLRRARRPLLPVSERLSQRPGAQRVARRLSHHQSRGVRKRAFAFVHFCFRKQRDLAPGCFGHCSVERCRTHRLAPRPADVRLAACAQRERCLPRPDCRCG